MRLFPSKPSQSQIKIPQRQTLQVQLRDQLSNLPRPLGKQGQHPTFKVFL